MRWGHIGGHEAYIMDANLLTDDMKTLPSLRHSIWLRQYVACTEIRLDLGTRLMLYRQFIKNIMAESFGLPRDVV